jgi:hypothetical protein
MLTTERVEKDFASDTKMSKTYFFGFLLFIAIFWFLSIFFPK